MPIFVTVMLALCNACWDLVLSRAAMLIKHVLCLVLPTDTTRSFCIKLLQIHTEHFKNSFVNRLAFKNNLSIDKCLCKFYNRHPFVICRHVRL